MSWLIQRGSNWYIGYKDGGRDRYVSTKSADKDQAEIRKLEFDLQQRTGNGAEVKAPELSMESLIELYKKEADIKPKTLSINDYSWGKFKEYAGDVTIGKVNVEMAKGFKTSMVQKKYGPATICLWLRDMRKLFKFAVDKGFVAVNPFKRIEFPETKDVYRFLTIDEERALLSVANDLMARIIPFALETGLRLSQIADLTWKQVNLNTRVLTIPPQKRQKTRLIPLFERAILSMGTPHLGGHVFPGVTDDMIKKMWNRTKRRARIQGRLRFHDLRHTCASRIAKVLTPFEVRDFFGWSSVALVDRYVHTRTEDIRAKLTPSQAA